MREETYRKLIRAIVEEEKKTIGDLATSRAAGMGFLEVEDGGVTFTDSVGEPELLALVETYREFQGDGVKGIVKRAAERERIELAFLPDRILPASRDRVFWALGGASAGILFSIVLFVLRQDLFALHGNYVANFVGSGFKTLRTPAFLFSMFAAFVIGTAHDFIPCSVPVWTTLLPSGENEDGDSVLAYTSRATKYFLGSAAVLGSFGFVLGVFGSQLAPVIKMLLRTPSVRLPVAGLFFGIVAVISLLWGFSLLGLVNLPSLQLRNRIMTLSRNNKYLSTDVLNGVVFGGVEVSCPFPTYHLLLLWIVLAGDPLYGGLLLVVFTLGKTLPIAFIGALMRTRSAEVFKRFRLGHSIFDLGNGTLLVAAGSFLLFIYGEMVFIGPMGIEPIIIFRMLQALLGLGIAYTAVHIYRWTEPKGWRYLEISGLVLALWSILSLPGYSINWFSVEWLGVIVDGIGVPIFGFFISLSAIYFAAEELPIESPDWFSVDTVTLYLFAVGALALASTFLGQRGNAYYTVLFGSGAFLLLPAVYGFYLIQRQSGLSTWNRFFKASSLMVLGIVLTLYLAAVCGLHGTGICSSYSQEFVLLVDIPMMELLAKLSLLGPLLMLLSVVYFGEGAFVFYHRMYEPVRKAVSVEGNRVEQLIRGTVDRVGGFVGEEMARRIVVEALEEVEAVSVSFGDGGEPTITMGVSIDNEAKFREVRDCLQDVFEDRVGKKAVEEIASVAGEIQDIQEEREEERDASLEETEDEPPSGEEESGFECDVCGRTFDSERGLHIHEGMQHDNS
ncbi:MAG: cytochrome c biogenesis protein CcdA [Candidatus Nanohaloarchaea archaeon]|nr:cytochrome c biogenesis protein CcdA [Candidatus Nanohaloarchaea archaeon]